MTEDETGPGPVHWTQVEAENRVRMSLNDVLMARGMLISWAEELGGDKYSFAHAIDQYGAALAEHAREVHTQNPGAKLDYVLRRVFPGQSDVG